MKTSYKEQNFSKIKFKISILNQARDRESYSILPMKIRTNCLTYTRGGFDTCNCMMLEMFQICDRMKLVPDRNFFYEVSTLVRSDRPPPFQVWQDLRWACDT